MIIFSLNLNSIFLIKINKPDIIIVSTPSLFPIINALIFKLIYKSKIILDVRDLWPLTFIELNNFSKYHPLSIIFGLLEKISYTYADKVISTLNNSWKYMIKYGLKKENFLYTPIGFKNENKKIKIPKNNILLKIKNKKSIKIGYLGSITKSNNLTNLLEAAKYLQNDVKFIFIIIGDGAHKNYLEQKYKSLKNVYFLNKVNYEEVPFYLNEIDILYKGNLNKSIYKYGISPLKLAEYMYSEKIIIHATNIENDPIKLSKAGFSIESDKPEKVVECIKQISKMSAQEKEVYQKNGKKYVLEHFNYEKISNSIIDLINSMN